MAFSTPEHMEERLGKANFFGSHMAIIVGGLMLIFRHGGKTDAGFVLTKQYFAGNNFRVHSS